MASRPPVRIALVGAGAIAQLAHLPVLSRERGTELVALCDNDGPKARSLADRFGVRDVYTDIDDLFDAGKLDAVVIATPNHLHEPHVLAALRAGVDVLCERPLSLSSGGVELHLCPQVADKIPDDVKSKVEALKADVISGKIKVATTVK